MQRLTLATAAVSLLFSLATVAMLMYVLGRFRSVEDALDRTETALVNVSTKLDTLPTGESGGEALRYQKVRLHLLDDDGRPIPGLTIALRPNDETQAAGGVAAVSTSGDDGVVVLDPVMSGEYGLSFENESEVIKAELELPPQTSVRVSTSGVLRVPLGKPVEATVTFPFSKLAPRRVQFEVAGLPSDDAVRSGLLNMGPVDEVARFATSVGVPPEVATAWSRDPIAETGWHFIAVVGEFNERVSFEPTEATAVPATRLEVSGGRYPSHRLTLPGESAQQAIAYSLLVTNAGTTLLGRLSDLNRNWPQWVNREDEDDRMRLSALLTKWEKYRDNHHLDRRDSYRPATRQEDRLTRLLDTRVHRLDRDVSTEGRLSEPLVCYGDAVALVRIVPTARLRPTLLSDLSELGTALARQVTPNADGDYPNEVTSLFVRPRESNSYWTHDVAGRQRFDPAEHAGELWDLLTDDAALWCEPLAFSGKTLPPGQRPRITRDGGIVMREANANGDPSTPSNEVMLVRRLEANQTVVLRIGAE